VPRAYSYVRMSSTEQRQGDSQRRQLHAAQRYCASHGLELDTDLDMQDLGRSAFHGANLAGALGGFLGAVQAGHVESGSTLIVESVDRLTRQDAWTALPTIQALVSGGITIVTLSPERVINAEALTANPFLIMEILLYIIRAHEESATKSRRAKETWVARRAKVDAGVPQHLGKLPSWITLHDGRFVVDGGRAVVIRRMAHMVLQGSGQLAIARTLNAEGVAPFGRGRQWHKGNVYAMLKQPSLIGTAALYRCERDAKGKMLRVPAGTVEGYFPAVLDPEVWEQVQAVIASRAPQRGAHVGKPLHNVFAGLLRCPECGGGVRVQADTRNRYLVCANRYQAACANRISLRYDSAEYSFLIEAKDLIRRAPRGADLDGKIEAARGEVYGLEEELERVADTLLRVGASATLEGRLQELEGAHRSAREGLAELEARAEAGASRVVTARLKALRAALRTDPLDRAAVNGALRQSVERILVYSDRLEILWRHGGMGECVIWPLVRQ
jgi:DNA invertase Pin-like site-specific DNA recombinase